MTATARYEIKATDRTRKAVVSAKKGMDTLKRSIFSLKGAFTLLGTSVLAAATKRNLAWADSIGKGALQARITTDELQKLIFAGARQGLDQQQIIKGLSVFDKRISKMRANFGPLNALLKTNDKRLLNILKSTKNNSEAFEAFVKRLDELPVGLKGAYIDAAFSGTIFNKLLLQGSKGLNKLKNDAVITGNVLRSDLVSGAESTNDAVDTLTGSFKVMSAEVVLSASPAIKKLADSLMKGKEGIKAISKAMVGMFSFVVGNPILSTIGIIGFFIFGRKGKAILAAAIASVKVLQALMKEMFKDAETAAQAQTRGMLEVKNASERVIPRLKKHLEFLQGIRDEHIKMGRNVPRVLERNIAKSSQKLAAATERYNKAVKSFKEVFKQPVVKKTDIVKPPSGETGKPAGLSIQSKNKKDQLAQDLITLQQSLLTEKELLEQNTTDKILKIDEAWEANKITIETRNQWKLIAESQYQEKLKDIEKKGQTERQKFDKMSGVMKVKTLAGMFQSMTQTGAQQSKKLFKINQAAAVAEAVVSTYQGAAAALKWGYPLGPIFAGLVVANGLQSVKAIKNQSFGGGGGGAIGGAGGGTIGGAASPGTLAPTEATEATDAGATRGKVINVNLGDDDDLISKSAVRRFIEKINVELGDGATLLVG